jgi:two-component system, response regulator PdtaR
MRITVLIVEDEPLIRLDAAQTLEASGFEVIEASNADEAIKILEDRSDISVVFTDVQMPGSMDGVKLAQAVRKRWPPVKLIITSGRRLSRDLELPEGTGFISKPYGTDISDRIRQIVA